MKQQVTALSPHQNGKVLAVLMAVGSLVFLIPFFLLFAAFGPPEARPPVFMLLIMPVMYLIFGYIMVAIGCLIYNFLAKYVGGIEFESTAGGA